MRKLLLYAAGLLALSPAFAEQTSSTLTGVPLSASIAVTSSNNVFASVLYVPNPPASDITCLDRKNRLLAFADYNQSARTAASADRVAEAGALVQSEMRDGDAGRVELTGYCERGRFRIEKLRVGDREVSFVY